LRICPSKYLDVIRKNIMSNDSQSSSDRMSHTSAFAPDAETLRLARAVFPEKSFKKHDAGSQNSSPQNSSTYDAVDRIEDTLERLIDVIDQRMQDIDAAAPVRAQTALVQALPVQARETQETYEQVSPHLLNKQPFYRKNTDTAEQSPPNTRVPVGAPPPNLSPRFAPKIPQRASSSYLQDQSDFSKDVAIQQPFSPSFFIQNDFNEPQPQHASPVPTKTRTYQPSVDVYQDTEMLGNSDTRGVVDTRGDRSFTTRNDVSTLSLSEIKKISMPTYTDSSLTKEEMDFMASGGDSRQYSPFWGDKFVPATLRTTIAHKILGVKNFFEKAPTWPLVAAGFASVALLLTGLLIIYSGSGADMYLAFKAFDQVLADMVRPIGDLFRIMLP
jgi:hypothetical protein